MDGYPWWLLWGPVLRCPGWLTLPEPVTSGLRASSNRSTAGHLAVDEDLMVSELSFDVAIVGAGVAGLMLAMKISRLGFTVALIEKEERLAAGPSTRNEGWLHAGTYHATSISDHQEAICVARRCIYGFKQIRRYAPEAVEEPGTPAFALVMNRDRITEIRSRWAEAGVSNTQVNLLKLASLMPELKLNSIQAAFQVRDVGINTRILYRKLLTDSQRAGAKVFVNTDLSFDDTGLANLVFSDFKMSLKSNIFIYTSGYNMASIFQTHHGISVPIRYWKSHLAITPRLSKYSVFCLDPGEAAMMNHGSCSVVGLNEDALLCESPDLDHMPEQFDKVNEAITRLYSSTDRRLHVPVACIKADISNKNESFNGLVGADARSLGVKVFEPRPGHLCALPGKMTETPYLTDILTQLIYNKLTDNDIALRPLDKFSSNTLQSSNNLGI